MRFYLVGCPIISRQVCPKCQDPHIEYLSPLWPFQGSLLSCGDTNGLQAYTTLHPTVPANIFKNNSIKKRWTGKIIFFGITNLMRSPCPNKRYFLIAPTCSINLYFLSKMLRTKLEVSR